MNVKFPRRRFSGSSNFLLFVYIILNRIVLHFVHNLCENRKKKITIAGLLPVCIRTHHRLNEEKNRITKELKTGW